MPVLGDKFKRQDSNSPAWQIASPTLSDGADDPNGVCKAFYVSVAGNVIIRDAAGNGPFTLAVVAGAVVPIQVSRFQLTGSTATVFQMF
jgi:hypothetical protein